MKRFTIAAAVLALAFAGSANAQTFVTADVDAASGDRVWGPAGGAGVTDACPIILQNPIFVTEGATLTILAGCIVRGQPRNAAPSVGQPIGELPGALIVTQNGTINAQGAPNNPIIFTTAAIDTDGDNVADPLGSFFQDFTGAEALLDADPLNNPLAPLNGDGLANVSLWGGLVFLGNAPTNLGGSSGVAGVGFGQDVVEGLELSGAPLADRVFGGVDPHDNSGTLTFASVRHAGDEIGANSELNCISLGGVGDATTISHVECYANFDDGFEWFGGTVNADHLVATWIGDDSFDVDQGYTGVNQFMFAMKPTFNNNDTSAYGSESGERICECDGDDSNANSRRDLGIPADFDQCWPLSQPEWYNLTGIGGVAAGANPAVSDADPPGAEDDGLLLRNGFGGKMFNVVVVNTGDGVAGGDEGLGIDIGTGGGCALSETEDNVAAGLVAVGTATFDDADAIVGYSFDNFTASSLESDTLANGNAQALARGASQQVVPFAPDPVDGQTVLGRNCYNHTGFAGLAQENTALDPTGGADGTIQVADFASGAINPRFAVGAPFCQQGIAPPASLGLDNSATFRGAFGPGALWTDGWTALGGPTGALQ